MMIYYDRVIAFYAVIIPLWVLYQYFEWRREDER